jgi:predicted DNA-binding protein (MmcQ/YjbR family)
VSTPKDELLDFCRALPGVTEDIKWVDHLVFSVGGKMFAIFDVFESEAMRFKVEPALYPILTREPGIAPAPYLARHSWVKLEHARVLPLAEIKDLLREAHTLVVEKLPRKARAGVRAELTAPGALGSLRF